MPKRNIIIVWIILIGAILSCRTLFPGDGAENEISIPTSTSILNVTSDAQEIKNKLNLNPKIKGSDYIFFSWNDDLFSLEEVDQIYSGDLKDNRIYCLTCDIDSRQIFVNPVYLMPPIISDDNKKMVITTTDYDSEHYGSWLVNLNNGIMEQLPYSMYKSFWHHDNRLLSFLNPGEGLTAFDIKNHNIFLEFPEAIGSNNKDFGWSSDDNSVLFTMDYETIVIINTEDNNTHFIPHESEGFYYAYSVWSPKEQSLAYVSDKAGRTTGVSKKDYYRGFAGSGLDEYLNSIDLYIFDVENNSEICLTCTTNFQSHFIKYPTWDNSGDKIAFFAQDISKSPDEIIDELYIINFDGSGLRLLAEFRESKYGVSTYYRHGGPPNWSMDDKSLLFSAPHKYNYGVYKVDIESNNVELLVSDTHQDYVHPKWLPR